MTCRTHLSDKIHQVIANKQMNRVIDPDARIKFVYAKKKGFFGKTLKGKKVKLVRNEVWREV